MMAVKLKWRMVYDFRNADTSLLETLERGSEVSVYDRTQTVFGVFEGLFNYPNGKLVAHVKANDGYMLKIPLGSPTADHHQIFVPDE